jgi:hypothetical protein
VPSINTDLGKLISTHSTAPLFLQRAAIVAVLSFVFFLLMLLVFYVRQQIGYFILSSAFLVLYIFTLIGWVMQKRSVVRIYDNGLRYKKFQTRWDEIEAVTANVKGLSIAKGRRDTTLIPHSVNGYAAIVAAVKQGVEHNSRKTITSDN